MREQDSISMLNRSKVVGSLLRHSLLTLYAVEGIFDGDPLVILIADDGSTLSYITDLAFPDGAKVSRKRLINAWAGVKLAHNCADLVVVGANQFLSGYYLRNGFRIIPKWVKLFLPVCEDPYDRLYNFGRQSRKYFKWMLKKSQDAGFECDVITDPAWFPHFYNKMYRPYALQRFGEQAIVHKYGTVEKVFSRGAIAVAKKDDVPVVGVVMFGDGDTLSIPHAGVAGGDTDVVREGAAFALDYFIAQHAHKEGYSYIDFGHSRPFLSDGTLRYKMNWHMDVVPDDDATGVFAIATPGCTPQARKFLEENPHFYLTEDGCKQSNEKTEQDTC